MWRMLTIEKAVQFLPWLYLRALASLLYETGHWTKTVMSHSLLRPLKLLSPFETSY